MLTRAKVKRRARTASLLDNKTIAALLVAEAQNASGHLQRAFRRAARLAFLWPVEAQELVTTQKSLTELPGVGPHLEKVITRWIEFPPDLPDDSPLTTDFLTLAEARRILRNDAEFVKRFRGDLQMHSNWSDGSGSISELATEALQRGYEYIAITDHTKGLKIAGGIDEMQLAEQRIEIREVNEALAAAGKKFTVLQSTELNLSPKGEGDIEHSALDQLDLVLGSFHSALRVVGDQTSRYIAALNHPKLNILGHPRGRVFNYRMGLQADWPRVFAEAARLDKAVEVDSYPDRQDLNRSLLELARQEGCRIAIDTDAHEPGQLGFIELGLASVLDAGIRRERIINFMPKERLMAWAKATRR